MTISSPLRPASPTVRQVQDGVVWFRIVRIFAPLLYNQCRQSGLNSHRSSEVVFELFEYLAEQFDQLPSATAEELREWILDLARGRIYRWVNGCDGVDKSAGLGAGETTEECSSTHGESSGAETGADSSAACDEDASPYQQAVQQVAQEFDEPTWLGFWQLVLEEHDAQDVARRLGIGLAELEASQAKVRACLRPRLEAIAAAHGERNQAAEQGRADRGDGASGVPR